MTDLNRLLADNLADREAALAKLLPYQRDDFFGIFKALKGFPATIRFLDPPLHEFLPRSDEETDETARSLGLEPRALRLRLSRLSICRRSRPVNANNLEASRVRPG
mgnify:CR=1 FL=1